MSYSSSFHFWRLSVAIIALFFVGVNQICHAAILRVGKPLPWQIARPFLSSVRHSGVQQFLHHYHRCQNLTLPQFLWGDEVEYGIFRRQSFSPSSKSIVKTGEDVNHFDLSLNATALRTKLLGLEAEEAHRLMGCEWQPEYGSWMIEAVPRNPYGGVIEDLLQVERSLQLRRWRLHQNLEFGEIAPTITTFPMMGVKGYPHTEIPSGTISDTNPVSQSVQLSDRVINPHPRFQTLTRNIRERRQRKVEISVPLDHEIVGQQDTHEAVKHLDAMGYGMGACCLQVTMQCKSESESRILHDQLAAVAPYFLALTAATPIVSGRLAATDTRWDIISQAVDDRTVSEEGSGNIPPQIELAGNGTRRIQNSRYGMSSLYIRKPETPGDMEYVTRMNDIDIQVEPEVVDLLEKAGVDNPLARHLGHMFIRDPLVIFEDAIHLQNDTTLDHFENLQSTNWRSMRWKPPSLLVGMEYARRNILSNHTSIHINSTEKTVCPADDDCGYQFEGNILVEDRYGANGIDGRYSDVNSSATEEYSSSLSYLDEIPPNQSLDLQTFGPGWRVEFRPMEVQLTDKENAAFSIFVVLLSRALLVTQSRLELPMSLVEENFRRAQLKDSLLRQKFFVRMDAFAPNNHCEGIPEPVIKELSIDEIFNGQVFSSESGGFVGLIPLVMAYLDRIACTTAETPPEELQPINSLRQYLTLISERASGKIPTAAHWMRSFVEKHEAYAGDGVVTPIIADDLLVMSDSLGMGMSSARNTMQTLLGADLANSIPDLSTIHNLVDLIPRWEEKSESNSPSMAVEELAKRAKSVFVDRIVARQDRRFVRRFLSRLLGRRF